MQSFDETPKSGGLLPPTGVAEKEARKWRTPVLQHAPKRAARDPGRRTLLEQQSLST